MTSNQEGNAGDRNDSTAHPSASHSVSARRRGSPRATMLILASIAFIVAIPVIAHRVDHEADEFGGSRFAFGAGLGWLVSAMLFAIVLTRLLHTRLSLDEQSGVAVAYDALPVLLVAAWIVAGIALFTGHALLALVAVVLCAYHLAIVLPRLKSDPTPNWVKHAPTIDVLVANVFIDNETPREAAAQLVASQADVVIIVESTESFLAIFDEVGGASSHPHRVRDPNDRSDYAVTIASARQLGSGSRMEHFGELNLAIAEVTVDGVDVLVVALNPMAAVDPGGHETWKEQIDALKSFVPTISAPFIIAGDLNTTRFRPEFDEVLALGLTDALDSLGEALKPSFQLSADGVLGEVGAVARLDHALVSDGVHAVAVASLEPFGSDHVPFKIKLAIRPTVSRPRATAHV